MYRGVIYIATGANDVFAVGVDSGAILWEYRANLDATNTAVCCGWTNRGVALGDGKVFVGQLDGKLVALDQRTRQGRVVQSRPSAGRRVTRSPPRRCTTTASCSPASRAARRAFAAASRRSTRATASSCGPSTRCPGPGEVGHDTWPQDNEIWQDGGAPVWNTPAVDPELGLIYFATGNPGPDYNGSIRHGDNLFSTSVVAVDAKTGKYRWHFQQVHHDIWDYDAASPVTLFDLHDRRKPTQRHRASQQDRLGVHPRSHERQTAGRHRRTTCAAGAAPGHRRDAAVSARRRVHSAVDRHRTGRRHARERRQDLHAVLDHADVDQAGSTGRRELAAELVRSGQRVFVRVRCRPDLVVPVARGHGRAAARRRRLYRRWHRRFPHERARRVRRARHAHEQARVAAALAGAVLQRLAGHRRRPRIRRSQRRSFTGARLGDRPAALAVPDRRRHERAGQHVRAGRQAVRHRVLGRQPVRRQRRAATACGCSHSTARSSPCRRAARC